MAFTQYRYDELMRYLSLFSGIEAASVAWQPLGWTPVAFAEIDPFCCALLKHRYPAVPNLGNVKHLQRDQVAALGAIDIVVFGSPCQDLSVAGHRQGLAGERSGLFFDAARVIRWVHTQNGTRFALWENVCGAFSSRQGRDFAVVVRELVGTELDVPKGGWSNTGVVAGPAGLLEWRVLDAQGFGVPQRRRRLFALADFGDWSRRPPILLEREGLWRHPAPRAAARQTIAGTLSARTRGGGGLGTDLELDGGLQAIAAPLTTRPHADNPSQETRLIVHSLPAEGFDASEDGTGRGIPLVPEPDRVSALRTLDASDSISCIAFDATQITHPENRSNPKAGDPCHPLSESARPPFMVFSCKNAGLDADVDVTPTLRAMSNAKGHANGGGQLAIAVPAGIAVRRLTPRECERLQGFPDNHTLVPVRRMNLKSAQSAQADAVCVIDKQYWKLAKDAPRYKALGNSMAVPVVRWIGQRLVSALVSDAHDAIRNATTDCTGA